MRSSFLAEVTAVLALSAACGGSATNDPGEKSNAGGTPRETGGAGTGAANNGGASGGSGGGILVVGGGGSPSNPLTDDCTPTPQASDYGRARAQDSCYSVELLYTQGREDAGDFGFPTFPADAPGGAGGAGPQPLETCPTASELEWTCRVSEGTTCAFPQCEEPTTAAPVGGECCYAVIRISGA